VGMSKERARRQGVSIHPTADVSVEACIGEGTSVWHQAQVRGGARIGSNCIIAKGVYIDFGVRLGNNVKIQNYVSVYHGVTIEDGVFVGPYVCFTNDLRPRAVNRDGSLKGADDWRLGETLVCEGASIGANATVVCGTTIGRWAMVGAGSVVTRDVPEYGLVWGNPARLRGFACVCGEPLPGPDVPPAEGTDAVTLTCARCGACVEVNVSISRQIGGAP
jgi:UDP-2-acetamido-3-amino-2,3-dideoxy-glucuronate N-acetyltransferase